VGSLSNAVLSQIGGTNKARNIPTPRAPKTAVGCPFGSESKALLFAAFVESAWPRKPRCDGR